MGKGKNESVPVICRLTGGPSCWPSWLCPRWWAAPSASAAALSTPLTFSVSPAGRRSLCGGESWTLSTYVNSVPLVCEGGDRRGHTCPTLSRAECHSAAPISLPCIEQQHSFYALGSLATAARCAHSQNPEQRLTCCKKGPVVAFDLILPPRLSHLNSTVITVKINGLGLFIAVALNIIITWD